LKGATIQALETTENKLAFFLDKFPEYRKTLRLALAHEESGQEARSYQGWQWHDVETHPTKLIRLVTEGISKINLRTRQATSYLLRDREAVKRALATWNIPGRRLTDLIGLDRERLLTEE
jgi:hypothetical protein